MATNDYASNSAAKTAPQGNGNPAPGMEALDQGMSETPSTPEETLRQTMQEAQERTDEVYTTVREYVVQHPMSSICMAFGAGALFFSLLRRP